MFEQGTSVSLESYAMVIAAQSAGAPLFRALRIAGVSPPEWDAASHHYPRLIDESAATDLVTLVAFDAALLEAKRKLDPRLEPIESEVTAFVQFRKHFVTAADPIAFLAEREVPIGMYARIESDWSARVAEDESLAAAIQAAEQAPLGDCPVLWREPSRLLAPEEEEFEEIDLDASPEIETIEVVGAPPAVSPFAPVPPAFAQAPSPPLSAPATPPPAVKPPPAELASTTGLPSDLVARIARGALPFARSAQGASTPPKPSSPTPSVDVDRSAPPPSESPRTAPVPNLAPPGAEMPFRPSNAPATSSAPPANPSAPPAVSQAGAPTLTLAQYASLCAELAVSSVTPDAVFGRYNLVSLRERLAVDLFWRERLRKNPAEYREWSRLYQHYQDYFNVGAKGTPPK